MLDTRVAIERTSVIGGHFTLEPGAVTGAQPSEQRVPFLRITRVPIGQLGGPGNVSKGVAGFGVPGFFRAGVLVLPSVFERETGVFYAGIAFAAQAVSVHAFALFLEVTGPLIRNVHAVDPGQPQRTGCSRVVEGASR
ncbi:hypothetical protein D3C85_1508540 [compost metagenome]